MGLGKMSFSKDFGFETTKEIQMKTLDKRTRNRLFNVFSEAIDEAYTQEYFYAILADKLGYVKSYYNKNNVDGRFIGSSKDSNWYDSYDIITYFFEIIYLMDSYEFEHYFGRRPLYGKNEFIEHYEKVINKVLDEEKAGYRLINGKFAAITNDEEIISIQETISNPFGVVSTHIKKALELYSDRENPDYENSIKESISAVESMCCVITGESGAQATLGKMLKSLESKGVTIHTAQKEAFSKLYGFTSDAGGIRHGSIDYTNATSEDALYMLVSCSAFVNYLKVKYEQIQE